MFLPKTSSFFFFFFFEASPRYMFLDHVDSFGIFFFFFFFCPKNIFNLVKKRGPEHCFCCFFKNTVPPFAYFTLLVIKIWQEQFSQKATRYQITRVVGLPSLNVKSRRKFLHLSLCSQTSKNFSMPCILQIILLKNIDWSILHYCWTLAHLTAHNWQKWKRIFLTYMCHEILRDEADGLKSCKYTLKITIYVNMWNLGQYRENLIFCQ